MACTKGQEQDLSRRGEIRFTIGDEERVLQVRPGNPEEEVILVPFWGCNCGFVPLGNWLKVRRRARENNRRPKTVEAI